MVDSGFPGDGWQAVAEKMRGCEKPRLSVEADRRDNSTLCNADTPARVATQETVDRRDDAETQMVSAGEPDRQETYYRYLVRRLLAPGHINALSGERCECLRCESAKAITDLLEGR